MRKQFLAVLLPVFLCLLLTACTSRQEEDRELVRGEAPSYDDEYITIGLIQTGKESDWRDANTQNYLDIFTKERGYNLIYIDGNSSPERQIRAIYDLITQQVDYIILQPIVESGWESAIKEADRLGIPVIIADRQVAVDEAYYTTWVGSDFRDEGEKAVAWLEDYLKQENREEEELNIILLEGTQGATAAIGRTEGILSALKEHPNWHIIAQRSADFTQGEAQIVMEDILQEINASDIDIIISENDNMIFGTMEVLDRHNISYGPDNGIIMISFDALGEAFEKMLDGRLHVSVECNPLLAETVEGVILKLERNEAVEKKYYTEEGVYTYLNAAEYAPERKY